METFNEVELSEKQMEWLAEKTADKLIVKLSKQQNKELKLMREYAYHNTRMLLSNYDKLKAHVKNVEDRLIEDEDSFWNHRFLTLSILMQNKAKTVKIMHHVDDALNEYRNICVESCSRGYSLLEKKYFGLKMSDEAIAEFYKVDRSTINKQVKDAVNELSILLYGVDALDIK